MRKSSPITGLLLATFLFSLPAEAYVGPGAGVSLLGALFGFISMLGLLLWSLIRWGFRSIFGRKAFEPQDHTAQSTPTLEREGQEVSVAAATQSTSSEDRRSKITRSCVYFAAGLTVASVWSAPSDIIESWSGAFNHFKAGFRNPDTYNHWQETRFTSERTGVVISNPAGFQEGLNLELTGTFPSARLFDMQGNILHEWHAGRDVMARAWAANGEPQIDLSGLVWRRVKPLRDGSLIIIIENNRTTPYGFGLMKLRSDSSIQWMLPGRYHHTLDIAEDGTILVAYQALKDEADKRTPKVSGPFLAEGIAFISPDGREQKRIDIIDAFEGSDYEGMLKDVHQDPLGDPLHINTVTIVTADVASSTPFANAGDLLVSLRNTNTVALINPKSGKVSWAASDLWIGQHEPVLTGDGKLLVFDNQGLRNGLSRGVEWDMKTGNIVWEWSGTEDAPLSSAQYGVIALLENGNRLVSETYGGRAIEITRDGDVVWEWRSPFRKRGEPERVGRLLEMTRLAPDFFGSSLPLASAEMSASLDMEAPHE